MTKSTKTQSAFPALTTALDGMNKVLSYFKPNVTTSDFLGGQEHNIENSYKLKKEKTSLYYPFNNYETDQIIQDKPLIERINYLPTDEMFKYNPEFKGISDQQSKEIFNIYSKLKWRLTKAQKMAEKYGTMYLILNINDGRPWHLPVDFSQANLQLKSTKLISTENCTIATGHYSRYDDPEFYQISNSYHHGRFLSLAPTENLSFTDNYIENRLPSYYAIHKSRLLIFHGKKLLGAEFEANHYRHKPTWVGCFPSILQYDMSISAATNMLKDYDVFIYKMASLYETIIAEEQDSRNSLNEVGKPDLSSTDRNLLYRLNQLITGKSLTKGMIIDKELEDAEFINRDYKGVKEIIDDLRRNVSDRCDVPESILFATSTGNLYGNDTGLSDRYQMSTLVNRLQREKHEPLLRQLNYILFPKFPDYEVIYKPTIELTAKEESEILFDLAKSDASNVVAQIMTPRQCATRYSTTHLKPMISLSEKDLKKIPDKVIQPNQEKGTTNAGNRQKGKEPGKNQSTNKNVNGNNSKSTNSN